MATTRQRVDKDTFKQIFRDHWEPFQQSHPRYQDRHVQAVIDKMLGCGTLEAGYTTYLCPHCLAEKRVAFSCKSSFCLSCCKVYVDEWVAHIGRTLYEGVAYRHVVLTMPDALHLEFYRHRPLLADLMQCGVAMLRDALSWFTKVKLEAGYVVVLETAGRSGHWNPHLHILMTSGGMTPQQQWREIDYFPFTVLHKKWQYHLFTMLKQRVGTRALKDQIDALWRKYPRGLVAYLEESTNPRWSYTRKHPLPGGLQGALGKGTAKHISLVPFCVPEVYPRYTCLALRTSSSLAAKLGQVFRAHTIESSIPHRAQLAETNPFLNRAIADLQQLGNLMGRIHPAYVGRFWQDRCLFLGGWHRKQYPFRVVSLGTTSLNLTEGFCILKLLLNVQ